MLLCPLLCATLPTAGAAKGGCGHSLVARQRNQSSYSSSHNQSFEIYIYMYFYCFYIIPIYPSCYNIFLWGLWPGHQAIYYPFRSIVGTEQNGVMLFYADTPCLRFRVNYEMIILAKWQISGGRWCWIIEAGRCPDQDSDWSQRRRRRNLGGM